MTAQELTGPLWVKQRFAEFAKLCARSGGQGEIWWAGSTSWSEQKSPPKHPDDKAPQLHVDASVSRPRVTRSEVVRANREKPLPKVVVPPELRQYIHDAAVDPYLIDDTYGKLRYRQWTVTHEGYFFWPLMHELVRQTDWRAVVWCADGSDDRQTRRQH